VPNRGKDLDAAGKSLAEALRVSFAILKVIMVVLVVVFLASGFRSIEPDEQALVLRFGRIRGLGEQRILGPGLHWVFPYPIDELVRIPVGKKVNLPINSFWYFQSRRELLGETQKQTRVPPTLDPVKDGYCITRSEKREDQAMGFGGSDYNIVHTKWQLTYKIDEPEEFFTNVFLDLETIEAGKNYADAIPQNVTPLLENMFADAVVTAMVNYTIDEVIFERIAGLTDHVRKLLQTKLDQVESGMRVVSVQLTEKTWPRQVNEAFQASIKASQDKQTAISEAETYAEETLNAAGGQVARQLYAALRDPTYSEEQKEKLWPRAGGAVQYELAQARAYRTEVVERARANADYLHAILAEYRKRPEIVIEEIYRDAIERIFNNVDETMTIQAAEGTKNNQIRVQINRDPTLKPKSKTKK